MYSRPFVASFALTLLASASLAEPVRFSATVFGTQAEVEIRDLSRDVAQAAANDALREIFEVSQLVDPEGAQVGGFGLLNAAAGHEPVLLEARAAELLRRGLQYCLWTNGAHGPAGGELYRLWGMKQRLPEPGELRDAVISASCNQVQIASDEVGAGIRAQVSTGSRVAALGMERGFALDRAAEVLRAAGVANAWLELGGVFRAMGPGPEGKGWLAALPPPPGKTKPADQVWLRNQSLAVVTLVPPESEGAEIRFLDQRTGVPAHGVVLVAAVTEEALDAEALAVTLFINGLREGHMRLGGLNPRPSVYWLLGEGRGEPLESTYRWSELERVRRRF